MTKQEYDALPKLTVQWWTGKTPALEVARSQRDRESYCYSSKCLSGTDTAEAPLHGLMADLFGAYANGLDAFAACDARWRAYAAEQQARVAAAPKIKRGPSSGHSVIGHRWVSPDAFDSMARSYGYKSE
jgi:hypothetical protein